MRKDLISVSEDSVAVAQKAMPGWHVVNQIEQSSPVLDALPGRTLDQLQKKFLGTGLRSAQQDLHTDSARPSLPVQMFKMARDTPSAGPQEVVVIVSGDKVIARQG